MAYTRLLLVSTIAGSSAFVLPFLNINSFAIESPNPGFQCDLPPILDPSADGLPSAKSLFSSQDALEKQVKRHQAIVQIPSVCWDDMGEIDEDDRWDPFYNLLPTLQRSYPTV
jgi:Gly-Xaa carboxypeptidase